MADKNELITVKLSADNRRKLMCQLNELTEKSGCKVRPIYCYADLHTGLELHSNWPCMGELTLAQLVVLAAKLKAKIVISNINVIPNKLLTTKDAKSTKNIKCQGR